MRKLTKKEIRKRIRVIESGKTHKEAAEILKISVKTVGTFASKHGAVRKRITLKDLKKNPYETLEKARKQKIKSYWGKTKPRTGGVKKKLMQIGFLMPICGFQNTPKGINYKHKDKIGGLNCPMFGPDKYDPSKPFTWAKQEISLGSGFHLDHINGERWDDHWKNLRILCPMCHAMTSTYTHKHKKASIQKRRMA